MLRHRPWKVLQNFVPYREATREVCRLDYHTLQRLPPYKFTAFTDWEKTLRLHQTYHVVEERLKPYVNKRSRDGQYVEITPEEYEWLCTQNLETAIHDWSAQLVELGFNCRSEICKAAYTLQLVSGRYLFFCLGMDYGLKTMYVTPEFKHRPAYQGSVYLTLSEALAL